MKDFVGGIIVVCTLSKLDFVGSVFCRKNVLFYGDFVIGVCLK